MPRTLEEAKTITDKGIEFGVHNWDDPANVTEALIMERAEAIVGLVIELSKNGSVNDSLLDMLHIAKIAPQSDATREAYVQKFGAQPEAAPSNGHSTSPPPAPSEAQSAVCSEQASSAFAGSPEPAKEAAPSGGEDSIEDVFPGYDDQKVDDIKKAILFSCADGSMTPEEWERIKAYEAAHEERRTILSLEPEFKAPEPPPAPEQQAIGLADIKQEQPSSYSTADEQLRQGVEGVYDGNVQTRAQQENLAIPGTPDGQPPMLPIDITTTGDAELSQIATEFHNHFARAQWLLSQEDARERMSEHLEREAERDAFVAAYALHKENIPEEKRSQPTALEAARKAAEHDAENADPVRTWRSRKVRHSVDARELKALAAIYDRAVWRITDELNRRSRLATTSHASAVN